MKYLIKAFLYPISWILSIFFMIALCILWVILFLWDFKKTNCNLNDIWGLGIDCRKTINSL